MDSTASRENPRRPGERAATAIGSAGDMMPSSRSLESRRPPLHGQRQCATPSAARRRTSAPSVRQSSGLTSLPQRSRGAWCRPASCAAHRCVPRPGQRRGQLTCARRPSPVRTRRYVVHRILPMMRSQRLCGVLPAECGPYLCSRVGALHIIPGYRAGALPRVLSRCERWGMRPVRVRAVRRSKHQVA